MDFGRNLEPQTRSGPGEQDRPFARGDTILMADPPPLRIVNQDLPCGHRSVHHSSLLSKTNDIFRRPVCISCITGIFQPWLRRGTVLIQKSCDFLGLGRGSTPSQRKRSTQPVSAMPSNRKAQDCGGLQQTTCTLSRKAKTAARKCFPPHSHHDRLMGEGECEVDCCRKVSHLIATGHIKVVLIRDTPQYLSSVRT